MVKKQFLRFITVGLLTTVCSYLIFLVMLNFFLINYLVSSCASFVFGIFIGFSLNKNWTFDSKDSCPKKIMISYFLVYFFSLLISLVFLKITVEFLKIIPEIAYIASIGITTCTNFIGTKFFVFKK